MLGIYNYPHLLYIHITYSHNYYYNWKPKVLFTILIKMILYYCSSNQAKNLSMDTDSITIGIELCNIPQSSEHCP